MNRNAQQPIHRQRAHSTHATARRRAPARGRRRGAARRAGARVRRAARRARRRRTSGSTKRASSTTPTRCPPRPSTAPAPSSIRRALRTSAPRPRSRPSRCRAKYGDAEKQRQAPREKEDVERRDNALVASYSKEQEIDLARSARAGDDRRARCSRRASTSRSSPSASRTCWRRRSPPASKGAPPAVERELESIERELAKTNEFIAFKKKRKRGGRRADTTPTSSAGASSSRWPRPSGTPEAERNPRRTGGRSGAGGGADERRRYALTALFPQSRRPAGRLFHVGRAADRAACDNAPLSLPLHCPWLRWRNTFTR